ncbi:MAG: hypothetical protein SVV03_04060 [Candidatus Nanohaloarchaea archaeon]|nr:hypothetical protein [Candidatus Nanohaloarchaea archaeon]
MKLHQYLPSALLAYGAIVFIGGILLGAFAEIILSALNIWSPPLSFWTSYFVNGISALAVYLGRRSYIKENKNYNFRDDTDLVIAALSTIGLHLILAIIGLITYPMVNNRERR